MGEEWARKHRPKSSEEILGQEISTLKRAVSEFQKGDKPILLHGPPGTGKTSAVYAVADDLDLEVVEVNASDVRNKDGIQSVLGGAAGQMSLFAKGKVILVDEIDGISGVKDRGGLPEVIRIIQSSAFPVVFTANDVSAQKFSKLRKTCKLVEFGNLDTDIIVQKLEQVAKAEGIKVEEGALRSLARKVRGDLRAAVNDLQALAGGVGQLKKSDVDALGDRLRKDSIEQGLMRVFKTTDAAVAKGAYDEVDAGLDEIFLWIEQNIPEEYKKPIDISRAYDNLSIADKFYGRIRRWQHYRFYVYCYDLLSAGIALSKDERYPGVTKYKRSTKPLKIWMANQKFAKKKSIATKAAEKTHTSTRQALQITVPYLKAASRNREFVEGVAETYELDDGEVEWLRK